MPKVGIYCRLSVEDKDKLKCDDSQSIQNQKAMLKDYCQERNWEIYDIYCDDGYSGINRNRPEFNRLLHDCETGKIEIVLCKDQSRFSRDIVVIEQIINDKFLEWGIRFIGVADNTDTDSEIYSTMRLFTSAYNEMYVKDISAKIRRTLAYKRKQGQFIGSFTPYGYLTDPQDKHHLVIDKETAPVIKQIFNLYAEGNSYRKIVQILNQQGIVSPNEYKHQKGSNYVNNNANTSTSKGLWTQATISKILMNEVYTGTLVQGKSHHISYKNKKRKKVAPEEWIRIPDTHEAIIDSETWTSVQERLHSNTRVGKRSQELSPLAGKVKCAVCGRPMKRNIYYNKAKTIKYYGLQCTAYKTGAMNCPNQKSISGLLLEQKILDELNSIIKHYCQTEKIYLPALYQEQIDNLKKQLSALEERQLSAKNRLISMYKDKLDGILSNQDYLLFRENLKNEEQELFRQTDAVRNKLEKYHNQLENLESQKALIQKYTHFSHLNRSIADEFIDMIEIGMVNQNGEREIHICWKL